MSSPASHFDRSDLRILLRIVGSRKGADLAEIVAFLQAHHWPQATTEVVQEVVRRLQSAGWVAESGGKYGATTALQQAFNESVRNCRDTFEEYEILSRIVNPGQSAVDE